MKILFLSRLFYPHIGGVEKHVEKVSLQLIKNGYSVTILTEQYEGSLNIKDSHENIPIVRIPRDVLDSKWKMWSWILKHKTFFQQFDVIHIHDVFWWVTPLIALGSKIPMYMTFHGWEGTYPIPLNAKVWKKAAALYTKENICVGNFIEKWYDIKADKITFGATDQQPLIDGDKDRIVVLGRISHDNDLPLVIESLKKLKEAYPQLKIRFLGDGDYALEAEKVGKVLGFKEDITEDLQQARWVITSSYLSIIDSLASGRYVFSFYTNPLKKDYLFTFPANEQLSIVDNQSDFISQFSRVYEDKKAIDEKIKKGQAWALQQTWENVTQMYVDMWTKDNLQLAQHRLEKIVTK